MSRTPCIPIGGPCRSYAPGHQLHVIHAKHVGRAPWGWRDGVVAAVAGCDVVVRYVENEHRVRAWHHRPLRLDVGAPVRVHERYYVIGSGPGWANVVLRDGLGPVAEPEHPDLWAREMSVGVVDLETGLGLPMDGPR